jgi:hypothetical protein
MTTITGTFTLPSGAPYKGKVIFIPSSTPAADIVAPTRTLLTRVAKFDCDDNGALISCSLEPLVYTVSFETSLIDTIYNFSVPDTGVTQDFALIASVGGMSGGTPVFNPAILGLENVAALRSLTVHDNFMIQTLLGVTDAGDGGGKDWYYDAASFAVDDGFFVAKPTDVDVSNAGRWIAL